MNGKQTSKQVAVLIYDDLCMFEFSCVAEIFGLPRPEMGKDWYQFQTFSIDGKAVSTQYNGSMIPNCSMSELALPTTIIIPGWQGKDVVPPTQLTDFLKLAHAQGSRILSICSGAFVVAATGLLDGKQATTHWRYFDTFSERYPEIEIRHDVLFVGQDNLSTSAGSAAGIDLCLYMIREDFGFEVVNQIARRLVSPPMREGSQAQYAELPVAKVSEHSLSALLTEISNSPAANYSVSAMASKVFMSERTFLRRFKELTGTTPAKWLSDMRLQKARNLLEQTNHSMEAIAEQSGFGTGETLRSQFRKQLNLTPLAYRKMFQEKLG